MASPPSRTLQAFLPNFTELRIIEDRFAAALAASFRRLEMASRKRSDSKTVKDRPPRMCIICTEVEGDELTLIQPCRSCATDFCIECLVGMFHSAIDDSTRMPPRCCNLIQIHTVLGHDLLSLTPSEAKAYREKFEEWISPTKQYCPFPRCSAFIPDRKLPRSSIVSASQLEKPSLQTVLSRILMEVTNSTEARFFREPVDPAQYPKYEKVITNPIDLGAIHKRLQSTYYKSTSDLTKDIRLIVSNAKKYNGEKHPVTRAAKDLFTRYLDETSKATQRLIASFPVTPTETLFACPKCYGAICVCCKQIAHPGDACDTSAQDHELAMLEQYGYKRCPRCKAGVKKMFGCSHMQCHCGAHWCYYCLKPVDQCDGGCAAAADEMDSEEEYDSEEDGSELSEEGEIRDDPPQPAAGSAPENLTRRLGLVAPPIRTNTGGMGTPRQSLATATHVRGPNNDVTSTTPISQTGHTNDGATNNTTMNRIQNPPTAQNENIPVNLDAGGPRRWAETDFDFGEEPEDEGVAQVWSCDHTFHVYKAPSDDGIKRGNLDAMECNRCFNHVSPKKEEVKPPSQPSSKKRKKNSQSQGSKTDPILIKEDSPSSVVESKMAYECGRCKLVVCAKCKDTY